jgi:hypothetical protein
MNFIFNDSNTSIGGIEVLFIEMSKYLIEQNHKVFFLINNNNNVYQKRLSDYKDIYFIKKKINKPIEFCDNIEITNEKEYIINQLKKFECQDFYVISPYFHSLQYAIAVFGNQKKFILTHLWSHPESWSNRVGIKKHYGFVKKKKKNKKYYYQKRLLKTLEKNNADIYTGEVVPIFNNWFYDLNLKKDNVICLPIKNCDIKPKEFKNSLEAKQKFKIIWCGRFTYFKNSAIIHIFETLEKLKIKYPNISFEYDIIGFGSKENVQYINDKINPENIKVRFLGKVDPNELQKKFKEYDIGIGMGLTIKKMAQVGLPSIIIDSFDKIKYHKKNANWLFNGLKGDAGDGYYCKIANNELDNRNELFNVLEKVIENPNLLQMYSKKCLLYVQNNYSIDVQVSKIIKLIKLSSFKGKNYPIYQENWLIRRMYYLYKKAKKTLKRFN